MVSGLVVETQLAMVACYTTKLLSPTIISERHCYVLHELRRRCIDEMYASQPQILSSHKSCERLRYLRLIRCYGHTHRAGSSALCRKATVAQSNEDLGDILFTPSHERHHQQHASTSRSLHHLIPHSSGIGSNSMRLHLLIQDMSSHGVLFTLSLMHPRTPKNIGRAYNSTKEC